MSTSPHTNKFLALAAVLALAFLASPRANAQETSPGNDPNEVETADVNSEPVSGDWPKRMKPVTLKMDNGTVTEALQIASSQAGIGLVLTGVDPAASRRVTLQLVRKPARDVITMLMKTDGLTGRIEGGILFAEAIKKPALPSAESVPAEAENSESAPEAAPEAAPDLPAIADPNAEPVENPNGELDQPGAEIKIGPDGFSMRAKKGKKHRKKGHERNERVQVGKSLRVEAGEEVDSAVAVGGSLTVAGHVLEDAVAVGGSVTLEPGAVVDGDAVAVGGSVDVLPGATLGGDRVGVGGPFGSIVADMAMGGDRQSLPWGTMAMLHILSKLMRAALLLVIALLIVSFAPRRYARIREYLTTRPGKSAAAGAIIFIAMVPLFFVMMVTVIGIPLIPFMALALAALVVFGLTAFLTWLGDKIPLFKGRKTPVAALAIGVAMFFIVSLVPLVGSVLVTAVAFFGAGATFLSKFGAPPKEAAPSQPIPPAVPAEV